MEILLYVLVGLGIIAMGLAITALAYHVKWNRHAWDVDSAMWFEVRDKIMVEKGNIHLSPTNGKPTRYRGCTYSMLSSNSPLIINHSGNLDMKTRKQCERVVPPWIRIEFQEVDFDGELTTVLGKGDLINEPVSMVLRPTSTIIEAQGDDK